MTKPISAAILSVSSFHLTDEEKYLLNQYNPLGISLFNRNFQTPEQTKSLIKDIKETIERDDVLIAIDEEGGRVQRLTKLNYPSYLSQRSLGSIPNLQKAKNACQLQARLISADFHSLGLNINYAPCIDVLYPHTTQALQGRCFSSDEKLIATLSQTMVDEYIANSICPCIKHFAGHGRAEIDPHLNLPIISASLAELEKDFYPFRLLHNAPLGMTAHIIIQQIDSHSPLSTSQKGINTLIRDMLGFTGFLLSDAIDMHALHGTISERAENVLQAGCDAFCYCGGEYSELVDLCQNCNYLSDKSMIRFAKIKKIINNSYKFSHFVEARANYVQLTGNAKQYDDKYDATEVLNKMKQNN